MSILANFKDTSNKTAQRQAWVDSALDEVLKIAARQLVEGKTTRDIGAHAAAQIVAAMAPSSGKGHAEAVRATVNAVLDDMIDQLNGNDSASGKTKA